jgi:hypothetical protein
MGGGGQAQNASGIACKIADGGIKLSERYFHARISGYGSLGLKANGAGGGSECISDPRIWLGKSV